MGDMALPFNDKFHWTGAKSKSPTRPDDPYKYLEGFGNDHASELLPGALPIGQNNPQQNAFGLYAEGITGTSFGADRAHSMRCYLYRRRPSVVHGHIKKIPDNPTLASAFLNEGAEVFPCPGQLSWSPFIIPEKSEGVDFVAGIHTLGGSGQPNVREGVAYHIFAFNTNSPNKAFVNQDGDFLIVAQEGHLDITTEFGHIYLQPREICVIYQGLRFKVDLVEGKSPNGARGYIIETWGTKWELPELGPLGHWGLANKRDFLFPTADIDTTSKGSWSIVSKQNGSFYSTEQGHTPFDVVAWHGNYTPYKYDLTKFVYQNSSSVDHTDPSVNTVLTAPSRDPNAPICDFLAFGPRWDVALNTWRPPYFHRNSASEFLARIYAPPGAAGGRSTGFVPGGASYESGFTPHGSADARSMAAEKMELVPMKFGEGQLTFMLESSRSLLFTKWAMKDSGVLLAEDTPESFWDAVPVSFCCGLPCLTLLFMRQLLTNLNYRIDLVRMRRHRLSSKVLVRSI